MKGKVMGMPVYVWLGVAAAGLLLGLYLRQRGGNTATTTLTPVSTPTDNGNLSGAMAGGGVAPATSGYDPATVDSLLGGSIAGLGGLAATGVDAAVQNGANALQLASNALDYIGTIANIASSGGSGSSAQGAVAKPAAHVLSPLPAAKAPAPKQPAPAYGGILSTKTGKGGVVITTYNSGRIVEKAPGKAAYVAKA